MDAKEQGAALVLAGSAGGPPASPGSRAWRRGMRAGGPRSQRLASGIDHLSCVK